MRFQRLAPHLAKLGVYRHEDRQSEVILWIKGEGSSRRVRQALRVPCEHDTVDGYPAVRAHAPRLKTLERQAAAHVDSSSKGRPNGAGSSRARSNTGSVRHRRRRARKKSRDGKWDGLTVKQLRKRAKALNLKGYSSLRKRELKLALVARKNAEMGEESGLYKPRRRRYKKEDAYWYEDRLGDLVSMPLPSEVADVTWIRKAEELDRTTVRPEFAAMSEKVLSK